MSLECSRTNGTRNGGLLKENSMDNRERVLRHEERFLKKTKMIVSRPMKQFITMDDRDLMTLK